MTENIQVPLNKPVTEEENVEFLKKLKVPDNSVVEQLKKTHAQISSLSLLFHSKEHRLVLNMVFNEAHVTKVTTVNQLENMTKSVFEIRPSNVFVRAYDSSRRDSIGEIKLNLKIGPVVFMIVFQEIICHGEDDSPIYKDPSVPYIEAKEGCDFVVYQSFEVVLVDRLKERESIIQSCITSSASVVATTMLKYGYQPSKGLGVYLQGPELKDSFTLEDIDEVIEDLNQFFCELVGSGVELSNWEDTPFAIRKESCSVNAGFDNMTCMRNSLPNLKELFILKSQSQEVEYDEEEDFREINRELEQFEHKWKPNLSETQTINLEKHAEKTAFTTPWGTYCYKVMPFGLKNAGVTYMRDMTTMFHDMMHKEIEVYIHDVIIKFKTQVDHVQNLKKFLERVRRYDLNLNPAKCELGDPFGKLLGFIVIRRGIELDLSIIKAIRDLSSLKNKTKVMSVLGRLNYINKFIVRLTTTYEPIFKLLKKEASNRWTEDCQRALEKIKEYFSNTPVLVPPEPDRPLFLYLSVTDNSFGFILGQHNAT
ncbi:uncharacterized protein [Solanum lycopersicum]|uniref:uncharacterized protein n=1 Tax=Solanum lycopersicum TaxID=4081 RepID=UPI0037489DB0